MRFDLRLHGCTAEGKPCQADVSVYANNNDQLQREAEGAAERAAWRGLERADDWIPEGATIRIEGVELLTGKRN
jgi:hypothetical protein